MTDQENNPTCYICGKESYYDFMGEIFCSMCSLPKTTGLICARLQPLHLGHISLIKKALEEECDRLILAVGSAQESSTLRNPYSSETRLKMLKNVFSSEIESKKLKVLLIEDIFNPPKWAKHVLSFCPDIDIYLAGSEEDASLFKSEGISTYILSREESDFKSGTEIRKMIEEGNPDWKKYVPEVNWDLVSKK